MKMMKRCIAIVSLAASIFAGISATGQALAGDRICPYVVINGERHYLPCIPLP